MKMNKKLIVATAACAALLIGSISTSLAWLVDSTNSLTNTFTDSDIDIELVETKNLVNNEFSAKMVPGHDIEKDPKVTVGETSEDCYVFVKIEKQNNFDNFMTYEIDSNVWTALPNNEGVYYFLADTDAEKGEDISVLLNDKVSVKGSVTKQMMDALSEANYPKLVITAYATQYWKNEPKNEYFDVATAWENVFDANDNNILDAEESNNG